ncbi:TPA: hypothetical protein ACGSUT_003741 [Vibrio parahaemolyticus]|uniref:hypothetical protein n=1 Tax=Vibrio TaxID=662 RepID=UPI0002C494A6|nr:MULTISPECIES: hypothetical protein [Vibrio]KIT40304.1 hypothetical protein H320_21075 [Vibrio parahaemolyticus 49]EGQ8730618.1 hypothetical protein [Vibrio parahaemolyticus]EGQ8886751.1 hypothetical protein [Vibrio parahaemolyticus]EGQ8898361.1 hypothetical protein [Vibrio parahaemolyticus]EGQ8913308.1 hypothetical protein [Vibrio parahaemolyticus]
MSSIKIKGLDEALKSVQKSSRARELTSEGVYTILNEVQQTLDTYLFKKDQVGIQVLVTVYTKVAGSYRGIPYATFVEVERGKTVWKLINVYRGEAIATDAKILNTQKFTDQIYCKAEKELNRLVYRDIEL